MRIVRDNPSKSKWTITRATRADGRTVLNGRGGEAIRNPVIEAGLRLTRVSPSRGGASFYFTERDGANTFETSANGAGEIFRALNDGRLAMADGFISGLYTFKKTGTALLN